jgi:hypothetical protein
MKQLKYNLTSATMWLAANPQRVRLIVIVAWVVAAVAALIVGLPSHGLLVAGPATGGGGGPEALSIGS